MSKKCNVTVKGTGQLNGPVIINKTVEMDSTMAQKFTGSSRYKVIEDFVRTHYPGVEINPKNFGVNVVPIKSISEKSKEKELSSFKTTKSNFVLNKSENFSVPIIVSEPELTKQEKEEIKREKQKRKEILEIETLKKQEEELKLEQLRLDKKMELDLKKQEEEFKLEQFRIAKRMEFDLNKQKTEEIRIQKINSLIDFKNEDDEESIIKHLDELLVYLSGFNLSSEKKNENHYFDKLFSKYKLNLNRLKSKSTDIERVKFYGKQINKFRFRRFCIRIAHFLNNN